MICRNKWPQQLGWLVSEHYQLSHLKKKCAIIDKTEIKVFNTYDNYWSFHRLSLTKCSKKYCKEFCMLLKTNQTQAIKILKFSKRPIN